MSMPHKKPLNIGGSALRLPMSTIDPRAGGTHQIKETYPQLDTFFSDKAADSDWYAGTKGPAGTVISNPQAYCEEYAKEKR